MYRFLACVILVGASGVVQAQTSVPNVFTAGTPAKAADVNANFAALVTAINGLTSRVSVLEGNATLSPANVAGTYTLQSFELDLNFTPAAGSSTNAATLFSATSTLTVVLNANGTATYSGPAQRAFLNWNGGTGSGTGTSGGVFSGAADQSPASGSASWSLSGNVLTLIGLPGTTVFTAAGSRLFFHTAADTPGQPRVLILIRTS